MFSLFTITDFLINNFLRCHTESSNCERDLCGGNLLTTLKKIIACQSKKVKLHTLITLPHSLGKFQIKKPLQKHVVSYLSGFIAKKCIPKIRGCEICLSNLLHSGAPTEVYKLVIAKDFSAKKCNIVM